MWTSTETQSAVQFVPRRSDERGHADYGWLKTFHTFSFAMLISSISYYNACPNRSCNRYRDLRFLKWGNLRVINEDRVEPNEG